jgi:DNA-binding LytR/AlgR family response regulator
MPKVDGLRLIRDLREYDPDAIIIAVSALDEHLHRAEDLGAFAGLAKPVESQQLVDTIHQALQDVPEASRNDLWGAGE